MYQCRDRKSPPGFPDRYALLQLFSSLPNNSHMVDLSSQLFQQLTQHSATKQTLNLFLNLFMATLQLVTFFEHIKRCLTLMIVPQLLSSFQVFHGKFY